MEELFLLSEFTIAKMRSLLLHWEKITINQLPPPTHDSNYSCEKPNIVFLFLSHTRKQFFTYDSTRFTLEGTVYVVRHKKICASKHNLGYVLLRWKKYRQYVRLKDIFFNHWCIKSFNKSDVARYLMLWFKNV